MPKKRVPINLDLDDFKRLSSIPRIPISNRTSLVRHVITLAERQVQITELLRDHSISTDDVLQQIVDISL